jgi:fructose-specific phosphotransferase system IIC component
MEIIYFIFSIILGISASIFFIATILNALFTHEDIPNYAFYLSVALLLIISTAIFYGARNDIYLIIGIVIGYIISLVVSIIGTVNINKIYNEKKEEDNGKSK